MSDSLYVAPTTEFGFLLNGPIPGTGPDAEVILQYSKQRIYPPCVIEGNGGSVLTFLNTEYFTLEQGMESASLIIHAYYNPQFPFNDCIDFLNNSDHNVVQEVTVINEDCSRLSCGIGFWTLNGDNDSPDSNLIQVNFIKKGGLGIYVSALGSNNKATGNIIFGNSIGSETDSLISLGILTEHAQNSIIENNYIQNLTASAIHVGGLRSAIGIESSWGSGDIISSNIVHKVRDSYSSGVGGFGIYLGGDAGNIGNNNLIYNNMVFDIQGTSSDNSSTVTGICLYYQTNPKIYYNSVFLSGTGTDLTP